MSTGRKRYTRLPSFPPAWVPLSSLDADTELLKLLTLWLSVLTAYHGPNNSQLDRFNCVSEMIVLPGHEPVFKSRVARKKKGIFIWMPGSPRNPEHALAMMRLRCKDANVGLVETMIVTDSDRGNRARRRED